MALGIEIYGTIAYFKILWGWSFFKCMPAAKTPVKDGICHILVLNKSSKLLSCHWEMLGKKTPNNCLPNESGAVKY